MAHWEPDGVTITDDYSPHEIDARELFEIWVKKVQERHPNGLIPIYWSVVIREPSDTEQMPFQHSHSDVGILDEDFLSFYTWPEHPETGERLNWLTLPVEDKLWDSEHGDKGGFIQSATRWKPSILQPYVYLPALISALKG